MYFGGRNYEWPDFVMQNIIGLRDERIARGMTAQMLSEVTGVSRISIHGYENLGQWPLPENYNKLARYFNWQLWTNPKVRRY